MTAARSAEVRLPTWDEMHTAGRLEILDAARAVGDRNRLVLPIAERERACGEPIGRPGT
ncbi:MAG: hypothetical protein OXJ37_19035 [Bryobacterales bacterium]|nr:hypothetical protein [Bryobacterales bacterium]